MAHDEAYYLAEKKIEECWRIRQQNLSFRAESLTELPASIGKCTHLQSLDLSENQLTELPESLGYLTNLKKLNLSHNQIISLLPEIGKLTNLQELYLYDNQITTLPNEIGQLVKLFTLLLGSESSGNKFSDLPASIVNLTNLQQLDLDNNYFTDLPPEIGELSGLRILGISRNRLVSLPPEIGKLVDLKVLRLGFNHLEKLPDEIKNLRSLQRLWLNSNKISNLPRGVSKLANLTILDLTNNLLPIPPEILSRVSDPAAIFVYYFGLERVSKRHINQAKLIILGQGSVGKTSLVEQILHGTFDPNQVKTEGISINEWTVNGTSQTTPTEAIPRNSNQLPIRLNLWDFGGQEIMHATHQFFLTKRSLYLLVLDSRLTQEENRVEYWLKIIQSYGGESPILIVGNKTDQHPLDIDHTGLQKKYPNIVGILETSAATGAGVEELKTIIIEQVNNLAHVHDLLPETWFTVKTRLEALGHEKNFITQEKYLELCAENEISDETTQRILIGFLHDLGVVLHFQDDPRLETLGILNPQWVTNGVYKILNSHALFQNRGVLTVSRLGKILDLPEYPRGKRLFIVDMMRKFELCYDINNETFLVPDLLPKDEPADLKFGGIPAFEYAYPILPSSVITRFIVRMNQHIHDNCVWRTGVLLKIGENHALVKADIEDRKITIAIDGLEHTRRDTLAAIRYQLAEIHASIKGLEPQKRVPVPGAVHAEAQDYDYLLQLERDGFEELPIKDGNRLIKINVRQVLSGVESESQRKETASKVTNIYIHGNVKDSNIVAGDHDTVENS